MPSTPFNIITAREMVPVLESFEGEEQLSFTALKDVYGSGNYINKYESIDYPVPLETSSTTPQTALTLDSSGLNSAVYSVLCHFAYSASATNRALRANLYFDGVEIDQAPFIAELKDVDDIKTAFIVYVFTGTPPNEVAFKFGRSVSGGAQSVSIHNAKIFLRDEIN